MSFVAAAIGGGALVGAYASNKASKAQSKSANKQIDATDRALERQIEISEPWRATGGNANAMLAYENGIGPRPQGATGFQATPGFQFQMDQGQQAIDGSAATRGQLFSGATLKAQQQFGQGLANQEYGNYLNRLTQQSSMGQGAAAGQAANIGNANVQTGNALASIGNAQAAGAVGMGNAVTGAINNGLGYYNYQQALNAPR